MMTFSLDACSSRHQRAGDSLLEPSTWNEVRRAVLRAELDAYYANLYGFTRDELRYILYPKDVYGPDFPDETFRVLKQKEERLYGEYRTRRLVLAAWDALEEGGAGGVGRDGRGRGKCVNNVANGLAVMESKITQQSLLRVLCPCS